MHQIRFWPGLCPAPRCGSLQHSPQTPSWFKGDPTSKCRGGERGWTGSAPAFVLIPLLYFSFGNDSVLYTQPNGSLAYHKYHLSRFSYLWKAHIYDLHTVYNAALKLSIVHSNMGRKFVCMYIHLSVYIEVMAVPNRGALLFGRI